jgi:hypothetical protein
MKKVLAVYFSQTDQLTRVIQSICAPLEQDGSIEVTYERLQPQHPYPFPWPFLTFLDQFPETVYLDPPPLQALAVDPAEEYDLIIIAYQVWYLSPSQPITAFLQSPEGKRLLNGKPVVTVIACRNMWLMAQEKMKQLLAAAGARLLDNVVLVDPGPSLATFITTPRWLLTGKKGSSKGLLPPAGLNDQQITAARRFGDALGDALHHDRERGTAPLLEGLGAVNVDVRLIPSEKVGQRSFMIWGKLLRALGKSGAPLRQPVLALYALFLATIIITVVPITMLLRSLLRPLTGKRLARQKAYFEQPSGSATFRMTGELHE